MINLTNGDTHEKAFAAAWANMRSMSMVVVFIKLLLTRRLGVDTNCQA